MKPNAWTRALLLCAATAAPGCVTDGTGGGAGEGGVAGVALMARLGGLWSGPATGTPLGDFPMVNMDLRAATDRVLFGRVDLDDKNSLRFAFAVETQGGAPVLVFRNGGAFQGLVRDSRTRLVAAGADDLRFCSIDRGCDYIDARFALGGAATPTLTLDVKVRGEGHLLWRAERKEQRTLPAPFPVDDRPAAGDEPFPPLPSLRTTVSWEQPLARDATVWLVLSQTECSFTACNISRSLGAQVPAGARQAVLLQEQLHPGDYKALLILDRNGNFPVTLRPDSGDGLSLPNQPVTVSPAGESGLPARIVYDLP